MLGPVEDWQENLCAWSSIIVPTVLFLAWGTPVLWSHDKGWFVVFVVYVLRVLPLCALVPRVQGSSGAVATVQFVWRGHAHTPTTRAEPWPDFALRLE